MDIPRPWLADPMDEPVRIKRIVLDGGTIPELDKPLARELQELNRILANKFGYDRLVFANVIGFARFFILLQFARIHRWMVAAPSPSIAVMEVAHVQLE